MVVPHLASGPLIQQVAAYHFVRAANPAQAAAAPTPPEYPLPPASTPPALQCPSPDMTRAYGADPTHTPFSPSDAQALGQTVAEDNPFDPDIHSARCQADSTPVPWPSVNAPPLASWITPTPSAYQNYNLANQNAANANYRPYNGRWVDLFIQIPAGYNDPHSADYFAPGSPDYATNGGALECVAGAAGCNPNPGFWYVQYQNNATGGISDRTTWEVAIVDTPPHLIQ